MSRPLRIQYPDAIYHVTSRGNNRQPIFLADEDREKFLELIERAKTRFNLKIFAFCLMTNHYHIFLQTPDANLATWYIGAGIRFDDEDLKALLTTVPTPSF